MQDPKRPLSPGWQSELERWLEPFLARLPRQAQRRWATVYITGLLLPGGRKSIEAIAGSVAPGNVQQLHHFISASPWLEGALEAELARQADLLVGGPDAVLVVDGAAVVKQGTRSVGVERQYCRQLGRVANCQALVSLTLCRGEVPVCVGLRLFLPERWISDPERLADAGVPDTVTFRPKWRIALEEIDRLRMAGVRFGCVLAEVEHGDVARFRQGLERRGLTFVAEVPATREVHPLPQSGRSAPDHLPEEPEEPPSTAAEVIGSLPRTVFRTLSWHDAAEGTSKVAFAAVRVHVAREPGAAQVQAPRGGRAWLIGEYRASGEHRYYLSNLPPDVPLSGLARRVKAGWVTDRMHRQMREHLGVSHFEGRSWRGLHHHLLLCEIAFAFLQHMRLRAAASRHARSGASGTPTVSDRHRTI